MTFSWCRQITSSWWDGIAILDQLGAKEAIISMDGESDEFFTTLSHYLYGRQSYLAVKPSPNICCGCRKYKPDQSTANGSARRYLKSPDVLNFIGLPTRFQLWDHAITQSAPAMRIRSFASSDKTTRQKQNVRNLLK